MCFQDVDVDTNTGVSGEEAYIITIISHAIIANSVGCILT